MGEGNINKAFIAGLTPKKIITPKEEEVNMAFAARSSQEGQNAFKIISLNKAGKKVEASLELQAQKNEGKTLVNSVVELLKAELDMMVMRRVINQEQMHKIFTEATTDDKLENYRVRLVANVRKGLDDGREELVKEILKKAA